MVRADRQIIAPISIHIPAETADIASKARLKAHLKMITVAHDNLYADAQLHVLGIKKMNRSVMQWVDHWRSILKFVLH